jgi:hypothetical protein
LSVPLRRAVASIFSILRAAFFVDTKYSRRAIVVVASSKMNHELPDDKIEDKAESLSSSKAILEGPNAALMPSTTSTTTASKPPPLELGWTQVTRKRPREKNSSSETTADDDSAVCFDCTDPGCRRKMSTSFQSDTSRETTSSSSNASPFKGRVIWLLHDVESEWFQGYLFLPGQSRPWGLLAVVQELDECLQCSEGGYRQIQLVVHLPKYGSAASSISGGDSKRDLGIVEWTGGDMMRLESAFVKMEPIKVVTGDKAASIAMDLFKGVWNQLRTIYSAQDDNKDEDVNDINLLDLLPDVAIVYGTMELVLPLDK